VPRAPQDLAEETVQVVGHIAVPGKGLPGVALLHGSGEGPDFLALLHHVGEQTSGQHPGVYQGEEDRQKPAGRIPIMRTDAHLNRPTRDEGPGFHRRFRLGNDVVDLRHRACRERDRDDRLLDRILTPEERGWVEEEADRELRLVRLWSLWAAKETAFKVVSKVVGPPEVFRHTGFQGRLEISDAGCSGVVRVRGVVTGPEVPGEVVVQGSSDGEHVHLVGWGVDAPSTPALEAGLEGSWDLEGELDDYRTHFSELEWEGIHTIHAAEARLRARERLEGWLKRLEGGTAGDRPAAMGSGQAPSPVEIVTSGERPGRTPPRIRVLGRERPDLDLSLSHHGRFVAWALLVPEAGDSAHRPGSSGSAIP
jgi:phosphopantetheinyl transferase (holo-ACP synthase)